MWPKLIVETLYFILGFAWGAMQLTCSTLLKYAISLRILIIVDACLHMNLPTAFLYSNSSEVQTAFF